MLYKECILGEKLGFHFLIEYREICMSTSLAGLCIDDIFQMLTLIYLLNSGNAMESGTWLLPFFSMISNFLHA